MNYDCEVKIVDMVMGAGKSSAAINYMNQHKDEQKFLYITPYLDEVKRVIKYCPELKFVEPSAERGSKTRDIKRLLEKGCNVSSTHALFKMFTPEIIDICRCQGYTLIMDEVANVIEEFQITKNDTEILLRDFVSVNKTTRLLEWRDDKRDYTGKFDEVREKCDMNCLALYGSKVMLWLMPVESFSAFRKVFILTYMFNGQLQRYYYDFYGLPYDFIYVEGDTVDNYHFVDEIQSQPIKYDYSKLIHILDNEKLNSIGDRQTDLSYSWYARNEDNNIVLNQLKKNIYNYFYNIRKSPTAKNIWTTFKGFRQKLSGKGYARGFVQSSCRATNEYKDRDSIAYCANKYLKPTIKNFFVGHGIEVDEDSYATSEMLQFIWRSAIRDGKEIWIYIPSVRMRELLKKWIEDNPLETIKTEDN